MTRLIDQAEAALRQGHHAEARAALEQALAQDLAPQLASEARSMLGLALVGLGQAGDALPHLRAAVAVEPGEAMFRYNLGRGLAAAGDLVAAVAEHAEAVRLAPGMVPLALALAQVQLAAGQAEAARSMLEKHAAGPHVSAPVLRLLVQARTATGDTLAALGAAKRLLPDQLVQADAQCRADAMLVASLAHAAMQYGLAVTILKQLVERDPADAEAATVLAQLLLWTEGPDAASASLLAAREAGAASPRVIAELLSLGHDVADEAAAMVSQGDLSASDKADLLLALAQVADKAGNAQRAWTLAVQGKALVPQGQPRDWRATLDRQLAIYRGTAPVTSSDEGPQQLYLLGTPRSGQSLLQSILAAAPGVASVGERGALLQHLLFRDAEVAAMGSHQRGTLFRDLAAADRRGIERLVGQPQWIVDKSPLHFTIGGNIARIHPTARFAAVLRDPADVAVSIWLRRFPPVYDYANDFAAILAQLDFALNAIAAWRAEGLDIRLIDFEALLADPAGMNAALFAWLGLEWDEAFLDPTNRSQPVPTYSAAQVRQPVGAGRSSGAEPYQAFLAPHEAALAALREKQARLLASG